MPIRTNTSGIGPNSGAATRIKMNDNPHNEESSSKRSVSADDMECPYRGMSVFFKEMNSLTTKPPPANPFYCPQ